MSALSKDIVAAKQRDMLEDEIVGDQEYNPGIISVPSMKIKIASRPGKVALGKGISSQRVEEDLQSHNREQR